jgi:hypothetical protein
MLAPPLSSPMKRRGKGRENGRGFVEMPVGWGRMEFSANRFLRMVAHELVDSLQIARKL